MTHWSRSEVEATVQLDERTEGALERKHQNISANMIKHGSPFIQGYKPLNAYQGLLETVVLLELDNASTRIPQLSE